MRKRNALVLIGIFIFVLVLGSIPTTFASSVPEAPPQADAATAAARIAADSNGTAEISRDSSTGVADFVTFAPGSLNVAGASAEAQAQSFFNTYGALFGIEDASAQLELAKTQTDVIGGTHLTYNQVERGVAVYAGIVKAHFNADGQLHAVNGEFVPNIKGSAAPKLSADDAAAIAIAEVSAQNSNAAATRFTDLSSSSVAYAAVNNTLNFYNTGIVQGIAGTTILTYQVEVTNGNNVREFVFVDAANGRIVEQFSGVHEGAGADREISESNLANVVWDESNGDPDPITPGWAGGTVQQVTDWQNEIDGSKESYNIIDNMVGYSSYDNAEATMRTVNNDPGISCPNANWNGISTNYCSNVTGDDTVSHEWGHAYTEYTHNLVYAWQPGALNESYSDIWGEIVDLINGRGSDDNGMRTDGNCSTNVYDPTGNGGPDTTWRWLSGEDDPAFGGAIRDMWNPTCHNDPGKVSDSQYWCASGDGGGVHTNSGVPNHAFALIVDGGTYNGQTINGIGLDKAAYIYWQSQFAYQTITSDFVDHASALAASCQDLKGNASLTGLSTSSTPGAVIPAITQADCDELDKAIVAVEFNVEPTQCGFEPAWTEAPPLCDGQGNGTVLSIESQDWESGQGAWTFDTHDIANPGSFDNPDWTIVGSLPQSRPGSAMYVEDSINRGACTPADTVAGALNLDSPIISLPVTAEVPRVAIDHLVSTEVGWDGGNLKISVNGGAWTVVPDSAIEVNGYFAPGAINGGGNDNPLAGQEGWTGGGQGEVSTGWGQTQVNLTGIAAAGDDIQLRFDMGLDGCNGVDGWYVDEVQVYSCEDEVVGQYCGNGVLDAGETCDDANTDNGDGCSDICQVEDGWTCTDPTEGDPNGTNAVGDWSFEAGAPGNPFWTESSTANPWPGFPFCSAANGCPAAGVTATGDWAVWIGGSSAGVTSNVNQSITIAPTATDLTVEVLRGICDDASDTLHVSLDGSDIGTVTCDGVDGDFVQQTFDLTGGGYNDGGTYDLDIGGTVGGTNGTHTNFFVDDVTVYDNVPTNGGPSVCTPVNTGPWACNSGAEEFENGIPTGWTLVDNSSPANPWVTTADTGACSIFGTPLGNNTPGSGGAACISSDYAGSGSLTDSYLCSPSIDLSTATAASFDFDFFFDGRYWTGANDVEIVASTAGPNGPYDVLTTYTQDPTGPDISSSESIDLSAYLGNSDVTVCARYYSGWNYAAQIDNAAVSCEVSTSLYCNGPTVGFEDGAFPSDWSTTSNAVPAGQWVVSMDNSSPFLPIPPAPEGVYYASANDDLPGNVGSDGSVDYLYTNVIDLSSGTGTLDFQYYYDGNWGHLAGVQVSPDGGTTWDPEISVPEGDVWQSYSLDLSAYAGNNNVMVRWHSDDGGGWAGGYGVDDINLTCGQATAPDIDVAPTALSSTQAPDESTNDSFDISNVGDADLNWSIYEANVAPIYGPDVVTDQVTRQGTTTAAADAVRAKFSHAPDVDVVNDGGFEAGAFGGTWVESSTNFGTPICDVGSCGTGTGTGPHSGSYWTWFGGISTYEEGSVSQDVTIPGGTATLTFWLEQIVCDSAADYMEVTIDGNQVFLTDGSSTLCGQFGYTQQSVDVSAYADGGTHTLAFHSEIFANNGGGSNFFVDDVMLDAAGEPSACDVASDIPWATISPMNGTTAPAGTDPVTVTFDSTGLAVGTYTGKACIESNDPDEPLVEVDLELIVEEETAIALNGLDVGNSSAVVVGIVFSLMAVLLAGTLMVLRRRTQ
ncbi:MAG: M4 family metallopeptidase [Anaerolineales bacterium]|nr:M4 family metallopeptidase [Anaerolineales bacterium]